MLWKRARTAESRNHEEFGAASGFTEQAKTEPRTWPWQRPQRAKGACRRSCLGSVLARAMSSGHSCRTGIRLHSDTRMGRRWPRLLRRRPSHPPERYRGARDRRDLPQQPALSIGRGRGFTRCAGVARWRACRQEPRRPCACARPDDALRLRWFGWWIEDRRLVRFAEGWRSLMRDGGRRLGVERGALLEGAPMHMSGATRSVIGAYLMFALLAVAIIAWAEGH
jgi:hypothetical protein